MLATSKNATPNAAARNSHASARPTTPRDRVSSRLVGTLKYFPTLTAPQLLVKAAVGLLLSVALGTAYYYLVERHFLSRTQIAAAVDVPLRPHA